MKFRIKAVAASMLLTLTLLAGAALVAPQHVAAADGTNLAGRPISGGYDPNIGGGNCQGIAYGRVNGAFVLFTADHCRKGAGGVVNSMDRSGQVVYGPNGTRIGVWGPLSSAGADHDLTYIFIDAASKPTYANQIYRGVVSIYADWWSMTAQPVVSTDGCDAQANWGGDTAWQMAQPTSGAIGTPYTSRAATLGVENVSEGSGLTRNCTIVMNGLSTRFGTYVESGSPVVKSGATNKLFGHVTGGITVTPIAHGLAALDNFYGGDTRLCITAAC